MEPADSIGKEAESGVIWWSSSSGELSSRSAWIDGERRHLWQQSPASNREEGGPLLGLVLAAEALAPGWRRMVGSAHRVCMAATGYDELITGVERDQRSSPWRRSQRGRLAAIRWLGSGVRLPSGSAFDRFFTAPWSRLAFSHLAGAEFLALGAGCALGSMASTHTSARW